MVIRAAGKKLGPVEVKHLDLTLHGIRGSGRTRLPAFWHRPGRLHRARRDDRVARAHAVRRRPDRVTITVGLGQVTGTATARVTRLALAASASR